MCRHGVRVGLRPAYDPAGPRLAGGCRAAVLVQRSVRLGAAPRRWQPRCLPAAGAGRPRRPAPPRFTIVDWLLTLHVDLCVPRCLMGFR